MVEVVVRRQSEGTFVTVHLIGKNILVREDRRQMTESNLDPETGGDRLADGRQQSSVASIVVRQAQELKRKHTNDKIDVEKA